jgi:nucleotide-binding universal stress UspA family protein
MTFRRLTRLVDGRAETDREGKGIPMYRTILVPVDGSETSHSALRQAITIADAVGATVRVFTVIEPGNPLAFGVDTFEDINRAIADLVDTIVAADGSIDVPLQSDLRRGHPTYEVILAYADEVDADLIVLGRHGTSTLPETVFGTTTDRVARVADTPVMLVPETKT